MENLSDFIKESLENYDNGVTSDAYKICDALTRYLDYSKLKKTTNDDPKRFDISKNNEQLFIDSFENANIEYTAVSSQDYYGMTNKGDWNGLSAKEKSKFYTKNGNIIILDKEQKPVYYITIEISNNYFGSVYLGSLLNFNKNGYFICINKSQNQAKYISHKALVDATKKNGKLLMPPMRGNYEGYFVRWLGKDLSSEYFIPGKQIAKFN